MFDFEYSPEEEHVRLKRQVSKLSDQVRALQNQVEKLNELKSALLMARDLRDIVESSKLGHIPIKKERWQWLVKLICAIKVE